MMATRASASMGVVGRGGPAPTRIVWWLTGEDLGRSDHLVEVRRLGLPVCPVDLVARPIDERAAGGDVVDGAHGNVVMRAEPEKAALDLDHLLAELTDRAGDRADHRRVVAIHASDRAELVAIDVADVHVRLDPTEITLLHREPPITSRTGHSHGHRPIRFARRPCRPHAMPTR